MKRLLIAVMVLAPVLALAQTTKIVFEDGETLRCGLDTPEIDVFTAPPPVKHTSLIKIRENFREKVIASVGETP